VPFHVDPIGGTEVKQMYILPQDEMEAFPLRQSNVIGVTSDGSQIFCFCGGISFLKSPEQHARKQNPPRRRPAGGGFGFPAATARACARCFRRWRCVDRSPMAISTISPISATP